MIENTTLNIIISYYGRALRRLQADPRRLSETSFSPTAFEMIVQNECGLSLRSKFGQLAKLNRNESTEQMTLPWI